VLSTFTYSGMLLVIIGINRERFLMENGEEK
jgi:hypothetical protein